MNDALTSGDHEERHSKAAEVELIADPEDRARQEARNGLRQFDDVIEKIEYWLNPERPFQLRPSTILDLHRKALEGIHPLAGVWRTTKVAIGGSKHTPPEHHLVPGLVEEMCDYINANWQKESPLHLASYVLWRMNWIHPFADGNGRTARATSYLVLCVSLGYRLPGTRTIPAQIADEKTPYYRALEEADKSEGDISQMEALLGRLLATQLVSVFTSANTARKLNT
jgi:Fic family protein